MGLSNTYNDKFLSPLISEDIEGRAEEDVMAINDGYTDPWKTKLIVCRAYIITCMENCKSADDIFHVKQKAYESEWKNQLGNANDAFNLASPNPTPYGNISIPWSRC